MDFLDSAVAKAKEVFDVACKTTDDVVTQGKQKIDEVTIENSISKDFHKLGMIYYEMIKDSDDIPEKVAPILEAINQKREKLQDLRNE